MTMTITIHPLRRFALYPASQWKIATLRGHRMTSSHSSKDPLRPAVSGGQLGKVKSERLKVKG